MNQRHWLRAIAEMEKKAAAPSLFSFRLLVSRISLCLVAVVFIITEVLLAVNGEKASMIPLSLILVLIGAAIAYTYAKPKKCYFLFYAIPIFCVFAAKILNADLVRIYGETFLLYYFVIILLNYILCSSRIGLLYSIFTVFGIISFYIFYVVNGFCEKIFGTFGIAYATFLVSEIAMGYFVAIKYEARVKKAELEQNTDEFTKLLNHNGFIKKVRSATYKKARFYVVLIDIDNFEEFANSTGSDKADEILKMIAAELTLFPESFAHSRLNTDKFAFYSCARNALILTAQLDKFEKDIKIISTKYASDDTLSFSSGIVSYPDQAIEVAQLLNYAEIALEKSKTSKVEQRNTFFAREYLDDKNRNYTIQKDLLSACRNGELQIFYQPKVSLVDKAITGMEALSRWEHPTIGYVSPKEFVDIAEKSGHIITLGEFVIESALYHIRRVHDLGLKNMSISINVSPLQLLQGGFCEKIYTQAGNFGVDPSKIYLEITEGTMLKKDAEAVLKRLKDMGFNLSLDDFGTGYSSLNYLHRYSFDELKIDKSFTDGLMRGRNERRLFKFLILLARELGMKTVTEGVEDDVQVKLLQGLGAEEIQGWYYSKALPSLDCIEYIKNFRFKDTEILDGTQEIK